eukprot:TRINITY_DN17136_c0_g3_i1.p1 TRINITY_DN17136_c0_g3~~TRINITY_DN17136_c0_g3_i1.p1  ORF type:complete len:512 (+),score=73.42 TRINITY_DN17136_c0_g3_i1:73-1536(+)
MAAAGLAAAADSAMGAVSLIFERPIAATATVGLLWVAVATTLIEEPTAAVLAVVAAGYCIGAAGGYIRDQAPAVLHLWPLKQRVGRGGLAGRTVYEVPVSGDGVTHIREAPEFSSVPPLLSSSAVGHHVAAVTTLGEVLCSQHPRKGLVAVPLPWPAAAVSCGWEGVLRGDDDNCYAVALQRGGGAVCKWRLGTHRLGDGVAPAPEIVHGLPRGDPVVALEAGVGITVALTASGAAFGWGHDGFLNLLATSNETVARIPQLSGRGVCRLACGYLVAVAETAAGELLSLSLNTRSASGVPSLTFTQLPADAGVAFPLHDMVARSVRQVVLVDAVGCAWYVDLRAPQDRAPPRRLRPRRAAPLQRAVRLRFQVHVEGARHVRNMAVLTDSEEMWMRSSLGTCTELPQGLLPQGGTEANRIVLLPDLSCGRHRVNLFARIAVQLRLPSDPVRVQLLRYAIQGCYIVGPEDDPFCWPSPAGAGAAAAPSAH